MSGHWDAGGEGMARAIVRVAGRPGIPVRTAPWWLFRLMSPFVTVFREMQEMRYLWQQAVQLDNRRLVAFLGAEPHTPLDEAVRTTLQALECLDEAPGTSIARA